MKKILFVCVGNSGRSQMAEAFFNRLAGGKAIAVSAGTLPAEHVDQAVVDLMREEGIDISGAKPRRLTDDMLRDADKVITMGCGVKEACPNIRINAEDWGLPDPKGATEEEIRMIREAIKTRVKSLVESIAIVQEIY